MSKLNSMVPLWFHSGSTLVPVSFLNYNVNFNINYNLSILKGYKGVKGIFR